MPNGAWAYMPIRWWKSAVLAGSHVLVFTAAACDTGASRAGTDAVGRLATYRGTALPTPIAKPALALEDLDGRPFDFRGRTEGYLTLLFFGYTSCPDVCPVHIANLGAVLRAMPAETRDRIRVVFVTVDPERDTPARVRSWLRDLNGGLDSNFIGLTGSVAEIEAAQAAVGVPAAVRERRARTTGAATTRPGEYAVGHAAQVFAFTTDNMAHLAYPFGTRQVDWARDLPALVNESWGAR